MFSIIIMLSELYLVPCGCRSQGVSPDTPPVKCHPYWVSPMPADFAGDLQDNGDQGRFNWRF